MHPGSRKRDFRALRPTAPFTSVKSSAVARSTPFAGLSEPTAGLERATPSLRGSSPSSRRSGSPAVFLARHSACVRHDIPHSFRMPAHEIHLRSNLDAFEELEPPGTDGSEPSGQTGRGARLACEALALARDLPAPAFGRAAAFYELLESRQVTLHAPVVEVQGAAELLLDAFRRPVHLDHHPCALV